MAPLSVTVQTTYAELVEQLVALEARRSIGHAPGTFVTKTLKRGTYVYFQHSVPGGSVRQEYLGRKSPALDALMAGAASSSTCPTRRASRCISSWWPRNARLRSK